MQSLAEWKFGSGNVGDKNKKKKTACKPRTASAYGHAVKKKKKKKKQRVNLEPPRPMAARLKTECRALTALGPWPRG